MDSVSQYLLDRSNGSSHHRPLEKVLDDTCHNCKSKADQDNPIVSVNFGVWAEGMCMACLKSWLNEYQD